MYTVGNQFENELKKRIEQEIERVKAIMETGNGLTDYADYRMLVGQVHAYRRVIENYCEEVNTIMSKR